MPHVGARLGISARKSAEFRTLFRSALVALLRNKMRSILAVLGITIGDRGNDCVWPSASETGPGCARP